MWTFFGTFDRGREKKQMQKDRADHGHPTAASAAAAAAAAAAASDTQKQAGSPGRCGWVGLGADNMLPL